MCGTTKNNVVKISAGDLVRIDADFNRHYDKQIGTIVQLDFDYSSAKIKIKDGTLVWFGIEFLTLIEEYKTIWERLETQLLEVQKNV